MHYDLSPEREALFLECQLRELQQGARTGHYSRDVGLAVARIHRRLECLRRKVTPLPPREP